MESAVQGVHTLTILSGISSANEFKQLLAGHCVPRKLYIAGLSTYMRKRIILMNNFIIAAIFPV